MNKRSRHASAAMNRKLLSLAVASCFAADLALANPTGPSVVSGSAAFSTVGSTLTVTNSPNAIINWRGFSIGAGEATRFQQQSAASAVLNRVVGQDPSAILGTLSSNGRVFLVNPNGILFGQGSRVDVGGLVASTLNITDGDFLGGRLNFQAGAVSNSIVNQGEIVSSAGGRIYLIAPDIQNHGLISSPGGEVLLAAGKTVRLVDADVPNLQVEVQAGGEALNVGQILTEGGKAGIYAGLINQRGIVRADSVSKDVTGRIVFRASDTTLLEAGSVTSASGAKGGEIQVLGNKVGLTGDARVDASGHSGGGTVLIGGDYQGKNPEIENAYQTYVGPQSSVRADAITIGDGGKVIVWADDATRAYGTISARGGAQGGNGGFVEVSGKNWLDFQGMVDTSAPKGAAGILLLDPSDVDIISELASDTLAGSAGFDSGNPDNIFTGGNGASSISWGTIKTHLTITNGGTNVFITTSPTFGGQCSPDGSCGDIDIISASPDLASSNVLRLIAHRHINVTGAISNTGTGALELYAGWNGTGPSGPTYTLTNFGQITISAPISVSGNVLLRANSGILDGGATTAAITAPNLLASTNTGSVVLNASTHMVDVVAGSSNDSFLFKNGQTLTIGPLASVNGIDVTAPSGLSDATINVQLTSGALTVNQPVSATASEQSGTASITLKAPGGITVNNVLVKAVGGDDTSSSAAVGGTATVQMLSGGNLEFVGAAAAVQATGGATPNDTLAGSGASDITLEVSTASGNGSPSGDIKVQAVTADKVNLQQKSTTTGKSILRASSNSLITANQLLMDVDLVGGASGGSIGTAGNTLPTDGPMQVQVSNLEAHTHQASPGIFIDSPNGDLQIGGLSQSFFSGVVRGVQNVTSGDINIGVNGTLTTLSGAAICGSSSPGAAGGPICTGSGNITLRADNMTILHSVNAGTGLVMLAPFATNRDIIVFPDTVDCNPFCPDALLLSPAAIQQHVTAGTLEIGRSDDTGTLTVAVGAALDLGNINVSTLRLAHENVTVSANINNGNLALNATNNVNVQDASVNAGGTMDVSAGNNLSVTAVIAAANLTSVGAQTISAKGITLTGGGSGTSSFVLAVIEQTGPFTQSITAGSNGITLNGGNGSGGTNFANIKQTNALGSQTIVVNGGNVALLSGTGAPTNSAVILNLGTSQSITVNDAASVSIVAQSADAGFFSANDQTVTIQGAVSANALTIGNATSANDSFIFGNNQAVTVGTTGQLGSITVQGGTAAGKNSGIFNNSGTQTVSTTGTLSLTGGSATGPGPTCAAANSGSCADIVNSGTGLQTVSANAIQIQGGSGGTYNGAGIFINAGDQQVTVGGGGLSLQGGGGVSNNFATIGGTGAAGRTISIDVTGDTTLAGGPTARSSAFIGLAGSGDSQTITVNFNGIGNLTLIGSDFSPTGAGAAIGAGLDVTNATTNLDISANNITLTPGTQSGVRFGHPAASNGPGDITVTAIGTIALNSGAPGSVSAIRTLGNVTLDAASITQGADSVIIAGGTTTLNGGTISLTSANNDFTGAVSLNSSGANNVAVTDANAIVLGTSSVGSGTLTVTAGGAITQTGPIVQAAGAGQASFLTTGAGSAIMLTNAGNDFTGPVDLDSGTAAIAITDANSFIIKGDGGSGGGSTSASSFTVNANGTVSQSASFTGTAPSVVVINAGSGPILLNDPANDFSGNTSVAVNTTGAANLVNTNAEGVNLGASSVGGALSLTSGGPVTQVGALTVGGTSTINAGANPITLTNAGNDFTGAVSVSNSGANNVALTDANAITIGASSVGGTFDINALSVSFLGDFSASNFSFAGPSYTLQSGTLNLSGTTTVSGSTTLAVQGGTLNASSGTIDVAGTLQTTSGSLSANTVNVSGIFNASGGTVSTGTVNVLSGGTLMGTGTIIGNVGNSAGTVSPGASAGVLTINGNYVQGPSGTLDMQIGGTTAGTQYDQLIVTGSVSLDGTLNTTLINGFVPAGGNTFTLIQSGGALTGTFGTIVQPAGTTFDTFYGPTTFEFIAQGTSVALEVAVNNAITPTTTESIDALIEQEIAPVLEEVLVPTTEPAAGTPEEQKLAKKPPACN